MIVDRVGVTLKATLPIVFKRNIGTSYVLYAKAADPIQQLFLDKIAEFKTKISDSNFIKQYPDLQKNLDAELLRVTRQYGANKPEELATLPSPKIQQPTIVDHDPKIY